MVKILNSNPRLFSGMTLAASDPSLHDEEAIERVRLIGAYKLMGMFVSAGNDRIFEKASLVMKRTQRVEQNKEISDILQVWSEVMRGVQALYDSSAFSFGNAMATLRERLIMLSRFSGRVKAGLSPEDSHRLEDSREQAVIALNASVLVAQRISGYGSVEYILSALCGVNGFTANSFSCN